jgi:hypothetical protein
MFDPGSLPLTDSERSAVADANALAINQVASVVPCCNLFAPYGVPGSVVLGAIAFRHGDCAAQGLDGNLGYAHVNTWNGRCVIYVCDAFFSAPGNQQAAILIHEALHAVGATHAGSVDFQFSIREVCELP